MGTDVRCYVEVRRAGRWELGPAIFTNPYYDETLPLGEFNRPLIRRPLTHRNYDLYAILAGVRDSHWTDGVESPKGIVPIARPKGLPDDISLPEPLENEESVSLDGFGHSWLSLAEIKAYDWDRQAILWDTLNEEDYHAGQPGPIEWRGRIDGTRTEIVGPDVYDTMTVRNQDVQYYIGLYRRKSMRECAYDLFYVMPQLQALADDAGGDDNLRLVFCFL